MELQVVLIGSCANSSYEDMSRSTSIVKNAANRNVNISVTPGSGGVRATVDRNPQNSIFKHVGGLVLPVSYRT
jgi:aconitate hydratase